MTYPPSKNIGARTPGVGGAARSKMKFEPILFPTRICPACAKMSKEPGLPGSGWIEFILWITTIVLGVVYSVWRRTKKTKACPVCGAPSTIPINTPAGQKLVDEFHGGEVNPIKADEKPKPNPYFLGFVAIFLIVYIFT